MFSNIRNNLSFYQPILLLLPVFFVVIGFVTANGDLNPNWPGAMLRGLGIFLLAGWVVFFLVYKIFTRRAPLVSFLCLVLFLAGGLGVLQSIAALMTIMSFFAAGRLFWGWTYSSETLGSFWGGSIVVGAVIYAFVLGLLMHFPVNYQWVYLIILLLPQIAYFAFIKSPSKFFKIAVWQAYRFNGTFKRISYWKYCLALTQLGFICSLAFIPTIMSDDNSYHLAMWSQITFYHQYLFAIDTQLWYCSPFLLDLFHAFISLIAGGDARGSLNFIILLLLLLVLWRLSGMLVRDVGGKLLTVCLFLSTPILANLMVGLQSELLLALMSTAGASIVLEKKYSFIQKLAIVFIFGCLFLAVKLPALILACSLLLCFIVTSWPNFSWVAPVKGGIKLLLILLLAIAVGLHAYINAYLLTENPVFPLYNAIFKSPLMAPENFLDARWVKGSNFDSYKGFFFNTGAYFESQNFVAGFQYYLLPLISVLYLVMFGKGRVLLYLLLPVVIYGSLMFSQLQYWRYFFPILPFVSVLVAALLNKYGGVLDGTYYKKMVTIIFFGYVLLNFCYLPGVCWLFYKNPLTALTSQGRADFEEMFLPEKTLINYLNEKHPGATLLMEPSRPFGASLQGEPIYYTWISPATQRDMNKLKSPEELAAYLKQRGVNFALWVDAPDGERIQAYKNILKIVIDQYGQKELTVKNIDLYKLNF